MRNNGLKQALRAGWMEVYVEPIGDPLIVTVSRNEVESLDFELAVAALKRLVESPETARANMERVELTFQGYDDRSEELYEIPEVRNYVHALDERFPFWLFFLSKHLTGLRCITYCFLAPFLTEEARARLHPSQLQQLLDNRWIPALQKAASFAGLSQSEAESLASRCAEYLFNS